MEYKKEYMFFGLKTQSNDLIKSELLYMCRMNDSIIREI